MDSREVMGQQVPGIGQDVTALMPQIGDDVSALMTSHEPTAGPAKRPEQILAESDPNYLPDDPDLGKRALSRAPTVGAMAGSMFGGPLGAAVGGSAGALVRGDSLKDAAIEGGKQGAIEVGGGLLVRGGRAIAHGLMKGTVPKNIAKDFQGQVDIPQQMLDRGAFPGVPASERRIARLSGAANAERDAAAQVVPVMPRSKVVAGLRPLHAKAVSAREPEMADDVLQHMRESSRNIGSGGLTGPQVLARKDIKQALGKAATNSANPRQAALGPQLQDAERGAMVSHLRETPRMAGALDESQSLMSIDQVMKDAALSNPVTRARIGGLTAAAMSPVGLGATAHAVNQGSRVVSPQMLRAIQIAMLNGEQE
jgi:hypothetical protein